MLSKKQNKALGEILTALKTAAEVLEDPNVAGIAWKITERRANGDDYRRIDPLSADWDFARIVNHKAGSKLQYLTKAIRLLENFLNE